MANTTSGGAEAISVLPPKADFAGADQMSAKCQLWTFVLNWFVMIFISSDNGQM
jgi:hypothetical protein